MASRTQLAFTSPKLTIEILEQGAKYIQYKQYKHAVFVVKSSVSIVDFQLVSVSWVTKFLHNIPVWDLTEEVRIKQ